jgi:RNA polymerase sigma-70 factor (ECF subfamily)
VPSPSAIESFRQASGTGWPTLSDELSAALARAHEAWPSLELDDDAFAAHLATRVKPASSEALAAAHVEDLYLACACLLDVRGALACFEAQVLPRIAPVVRRYDPDPAFVDEVRALVREKLFMPPPRIAEYSGLGPLVRWVRTVAARVALNHLQPERRRARAELEDLDALPFSAPEPDLAILQGRHRATFRAAFHAALGALPVRERTALKLNAIDGLSLEKIGAMYACDKSTVSRWLSHAHEQLLEHTRLHLRAALALGESEVESLTRALNSQLAPSLLNLLEE